MLVLSRKKNESIVINDDITIVVVEIRGDKVRLGIASKGKGKGKSGGARVITCVRVVGQEVWLLTIYDKSDKATITDKELSQLVKQIP